MSEIELSILLFSGPFSVRGSCAYSLRLAERLPLNGVRSSLVCPDARQVEPERRRDLHISEFSHLNWPVWGKVVMRMMLRQFQLDPPDLIHIQARNAVTQGMWLARHLQRPFVLTVHDYLQPHERFVIDRRWCRRIIAVSEAVKTDLQERTGLPDDFISVIHSGVDATESCKRKQRPRTQSRACRRDGGATRSRKGIPVLPGCRRARPGNRPRRGIRHRGGWSGRVKPQDVSLEKLKIDDRVTFVPNLLEFDDALQAMDVFCLPSLQQGIGTIMLQAMAMGRPVIATRVGGVYRVVREGETGFLIPPANSEALASRIVDLLDDPVQARRIGRAAREEVMREFNVDQMASKTVALYHEILSAELDENATRSLSLGGVR